MRLKVMILFLTFWNKREEKVNVGSFFFKNYHNETVAVNELHIKLLLFLGYNLLSFAADESFLSSQCQNNDNIKNGRKF